MERLRIDEMKEKLRQEKEDQKDTVKYLETQEEKECFIAVHKQMISMCEQLAEWLEELKAYKNAEEQGLLLRLPCKIRDTVYEHRSCKKFCDWLKSTAYNVEKVVAELEEARSGNNGWEDEPYFGGQATAYEHAIDIVKRGGVE